MTRVTTRHFGVLIAALAGSAIALVAGQQPSGAPVYTAAQAAAGRAAYQANCASCHVADLGGRNEAPQLAGGDFMNTWRSRTTKDLFDYMSSTMPPGGPSLDPRSVREHRRLHPAAEQRGCRPARRSLRQLPWRSARSPRGSVPRPRRRRPRRLLPAAVVVAVAAQALQKKAVPLAPAGAAPRNRAASPSPAT